MKKFLFVALTGMVLISGCKPEAKKAEVGPPKWKGAPYRLEVDAAKPSKTGLLPGIKFTANPEAVERRATLVVRFDSSAIKSENTINDQMILPPFDVKGSEGVLPPDAIEIANTGLTTLFHSYKVKGKVKVKVALEQSSLNRTAGPDEIGQKKLSDWVETEVTAK